MGSCSSMPWSCFCFPALLLISCCVTNQPEIMAENKRHLIMLMDSVDQEFGQGLAGMACVISALRCLGPQLGGRRQLAMTEQPTAGLDGRLLRSQVWRLGWDDSKTWLSCWPQCPHVAFPCGLGFSHHGGWFLRGRKPRVTVSKNPDGTCMAFYDLASQVLKHYFHCCTDQSNHQPSLIAEEGTWTPF